MKKTILLLIGVFLLVGCSSNGSDNTIKDFKNSIKKSNSYEIKGTMELRSDEETFDYNINVKYLKENYYMVEMINQTNDYKQIILKNDEGLYVITPSLNKSFKFESNWPDNSSQAYILSSLIKDIEKDMETTVTNNKNGYVIKTKVNYPNNNDLKYQKIYLNKNNKLEKVEVFGESDIAKIIVNFKEIDLKTNNKEKDFELKKFIDIENNQEEKNEDVVNNTQEKDKQELTNQEQCDNKTCESKTTSGQITEAIYPLYTPSNTYLTGSEVINTENDNRIILTFSGDKNYVLVEEAAMKALEHEIIPVYGEPIMLNDSIAALSTNSMYWTNNNVDYYIVSDDLTVSEMVFIATSLGNTTATMATK